MFTITDNIDALLKEKDLTKTQLAKKMGIARVTLYAMLSGDMKLSTLERFADALDVQVEDLLANADRMRLRGDSGHVEKREHVDESGSWFTTLGRISFKDQAFVNADLHLKDIEKGTLRTCFKGSFRIEIEGVAEAIICRLLENNIAVSNSIKVKALEGEEVIDLDMETIQRVSLIKEIRAVFA
ncbi:helix-turn-helix transcriptional regulator [Limibacter armeniacum]|uniref:helix-turn-helix domain-containing protein n=1 Tax=Limibacter armeniacum TaxID=466084 RepID=UPI002FE52782